MLDETDRVRVPVDEGEAIVGRADGEELLVLSPGDVRHLPAVLQQPVVRGEEEPQVQRPAFLLHGLLIVEQSVGAGRPASELELAARIESLVAILFLLLLLGLLGALVRLVFAAAGRRGQPVEFEARQVGEDQIKGLRVEELPRLLNDPILSIQGRLVASLVGRALVHPGGGRQVEQSFPEGSVLVRLEEVLELDLGLVAKGLLDVPLSGRIQVGGIDPGVELLLVHVPGPGQLLGRLQVGWRARDGLAVEPAAHGEAALVRAEHLRNLMEGRGGDGEKGEAVPFGPDSGGHLVRLTVGVQAEEVQASAVHFRPVLVH